MPENLSGGESRRAAIAKAVVRRAGVRLLDEPLSGLDANVRSGIQDALVLWHRKTPGTTIHVTHDGAEAMRVADRIAVMDGGKIVQFASPQEIYDQPATKTVALAIGTPPMKFVNATIESDKLTFSTPGIESKSLANLPKASSIEIGFRDRALCVANANYDGAGIVIAGKVSRAQVVDGQNVLTVDCDFGASVNAKQETPMPAVGEMVTLFCPQESLHYFDALTGQNLKSRI